MSEIKRLQTKIDSCYRCIESNNDLILFYKKQGQLWNVAQLEKENIETLRLIREEKENLNFLKDRNNRRVIKTQKRTYNDPFKILEKNEVNILEQLNGK